jgi:hypothetical protein
MRFQVLSSICHSVSANREPQNMVIRDQPLHVGHAQKNRSWIVIWNVLEQLASRSAELRNQPESVSTMKLVFVIEWIQCVTSR